MTIEVIAQKRVVEGTGASRRLRRAGKVPGVVYGGNQDAVSIELDHNTLFYALKDEAFHGAVLTLNLDGATEAVLLRDTQLHPWKPQVLHVDFQRVNANEKITTKVALHFKNADICPAVKLGGKKITHIMNDVVVKALPANLPAFVEVDLSALQSGQSVHLSDLPVAEGVELVELARGHDLAVAQAS
ncbi:50S ribosomal protein L25/general stress protein Ctc [Aquaspirillum sp. LM1]|jgi:large subunit ribosomal protein L25|uniref:50S ribosomal protein L25/general stress protein Ctc n=1 Tax=Aquaspirillum sp. LM1 TaxID=1938604 RepID=UPI00098399EB|nr:50S ribosomal protein L25/general stress protein Ctc [Aquaspirillum sp. LM1]AQR65758.1 50S ribosomal protein L25/general stress protein Ctc [Aquaspirillum sp. LM1]